MWHPLPSFDHLPAYERSTIDKGLYRLARSRLAETLHPAVDSLLIYDCRVECSSFDTTTGRIGAHWREIGEM
jgi:hypothetical protein